MPVEEAECAGHDREGRDDGAAEQQQRTIVASRESERVSRSLNGRPVGRHRRALGAANACHCVAAAALLRGFVIVVKAGLRGRDVSGWRRASSASCASPRTKPRLPRRETRAHRSAAGHSPRGVSAIVTSGSTARGSRRMVRCVPPAQPFSPSASASSTRSAAAGSSVIWTTRSGCCALLSIRMV